MWQEFTALVCHAQHTIPRDDARTSNGSDVRQRGLFSRLFGSVSSAEDPQATALEAQLDASAPTHKVLLLSAGEQGKSTFFKALRHLYRDPTWTDEDRANFRSVLVDNLKLKLQWLASVAGDGEGGNKHAALAEELRDVALVTPDAAQDLLLRDERVRDIHAVAERLGTTIGKVADTRPYCDRAGAILRQTGEYMCSDTDILAAYVRTSGIVDASFTLNGDRFTVFDVGGQRNERKKWIHCFDQVAGAVLHFRLDCYNDE